MRVKVKKYIRKIINGIIRNTKRRTARHNNLTPTLQKCMSKDADANGAYCIALKGLYDVLTVKKYWKEGEKFDRKLLAITNYKWFDFIQNRRF